MKKTQRKPTWATALKISLILAASVLICVTVLGVYLTKKAENAANNAYEELGDRFSSDKRSSKVTPLEDNISMLFIGIDDSEQRSQSSSKSRSDALILATLNNKTRTVKLLSIPRDSYVHIPYVDYKDKINHAHSYGGTLATLETVEELFNIPIDYYVRMNFDAFIDVVDALGGIEAEVPYAMLEKDEFDNNTVELEPGFQELDGREALALARTRKQDSDIYRGMRQQEILGAIAKKIASPTSIFKYDNVIDAVGDNMRTNMTFSEMKSLLGYVSSGMPRIDNINLDGTDDMSTGVYYYQLDPQSVEEVSSILQSHLGLIKEDTINLSNSTSAEKFTSQALN